MKRSKVAVSAASRSSTVWKKRLCVVSRLVVFHTPSMPLNSGEYGGRRHSSIRRRFFASHVLASALSRWQGPLSMIRKIFRRRRWISCLRNARKVEQLKTGANW